MCGCRVAGCLQFLELLVSVGMLVVGIGLVVDIMSHGLVVCAVGCVTLFVWRVLACCYELVLRVGAVGWVVWDVACCLRALVVAICFTCLC